MYNLAHLKKRRDFLNVAQINKKWVTKGLILQMRPWDDHVRAQMQETDIRFGLIVSKKTGNAVRRNRIKRRLRALVAEILPHYCKSGHDLVLIGRFCTWDRPWDDLRKDLITALKALDLYVKNSKDMEYDTAHQ